MFRVSELVTLVSSRRFPTQTTTVLEPISQFSKCAVFLGFGVHGPSGGCKIWFQQAELKKGMRTWRRRSSVASLVIATAWWIARAPLALACRLAPPAPSRVSRVARRHDGDSSLHSRAIRGCISACASGAVDLRSLRSSSRRRGGSLARLSRSRVGLRLPRRRASLALLVVTTAMIRCILAPFAVASRRVPLAPSIFGRFARHRDGVVDRSRASRARMSARASRAVARLSRCSSSRRR